jgi:hypothetical protein
MGTKEVRRQGGREREEGERESGGGCRKFTRYHDVLRLFWVDEGDGTLDL